MSTQAVQQMPSANNRPVIRLLIIACCLFDLVIASTGNGRSVDVLTSALVTGAVIGQNSALAAWMIFSSRSAVLKILLGAAAIVILSWTAAACTAPNWQQWLTFLAAHASLVGGYFIVQFRRGARLIDAYSPNPTGATTAPRRRLQTSLISLFGAVTVCAIVMGVARWMKPPGYDSRVIALYMVEFAIIGAASIWSSIAQNSTWWRLFIVVILAPALGDAFTFVDGYGPLTRMSGSAVFSAMTGVLAGLVARMSGYKIEFLKRGDSEPAPNQESVPTTPEQAGPEVTP